MVQLTYRAAVAYALDAEMRLDERVVLLGEDVRNGGAFKDLAGLDESFAEHRVRDTPISEMAILGAAMGAAMNGLRPVAEIMFADFIGSCHDILINQIPKYRYMSDGQVTVPLVVRMHNGAGLRFGAQHSQNVEGWLANVPGLKIVAPSTPSDVVRLLRSAVRDDDPVVFLEHKGLLGSKEEVDLDDLQPEPLGQARVVRKGSDAVIVSLGAMVPRALAAADALAADGINVRVLDLRSLVPLDRQALLESAIATRNVFVVEEGPLPYGWGGEIASLIVEQAWESLERPPVRLGGIYAPMPAAANLEDAARPTPDVIESTVRASLDKPGRKPW